MFDEWINPLGKGYLIGEYRPKEEDMSKKYVIVGGVAGGGSTAARIRRLDENAAINVYDKGPDIAFSNCCLPNYLSREVENSEDLILFNPQEMKALFNLDMHVNHEVIELLPEEHKVKVKNLVSGEVFEDDYDYLILSPGSKAILPRSIKGIDGDNVFSVKNVADIKKLDGYLIDNEVTDVAVVGGGFIGLEVAECLKEAGKNVSLIEAAPQVMMPFDEDMVQILHKEIMDHGIDLQIGEAVVEIASDKVVFKSGKEVKAQAVVMSVGVRPDVQFAVDAGIELGETGGILVDHNYKTNLPDVYAVGDAIESFHALTKKKMILGLAGPAQKQARNVADHLFGRQITNKGVIGSSCIRVFCFNAARTGLSERECQKEGLSYETVRLAPKDMVGLMPKASPIYLKLVFEMPTGKILGAQAIGKGNVTKRIDVIATLIAMGGTLEDLKDLELCYAPPFSTAKDPVNFAALIGLNVLNGEYRQVPMSKIRELVETGAFIVDVRGKEVFDQGHVKGAINIPLGEIRSRYHEIPKDVPVYLHCQTSWFSYYAIRALQGLGYTNLYNIQGSFGAFSYNEYFEDKRTGRESILTRYMF